MPSDDHVSGLLLRWDRRSFAPWPGNQHRRLLVADSWLVQDGAVRALAAHHRRFAGSCRQEVGLPPSVVDDFLAAVTTEIPRRGRWFPRIECARRPAGRGGPDAELLLWVRPAPPPSDCVVVTHQRGDPRRKPQVKGPDLTDLLALRRSAAAVGASEVVLLSDGGLVIEGALSAIVWWRRDVLCLPHKSLITLNSVTRSLVLELASRRGVGVRWERCAVESLDQLEIWSLSALHGIRPVTGWHHPDFSPRPGPPNRAATWQADLLRLAGEEPSADGPPLLSASG